MQTIVRELIDFVIHSLTLYVDSILCTQGPTNGLIILFDMNNVGYRHLLRPSIDTLRGFFRYLQDALPARLEAMHIINCDSVFDVVLSMIKPFMKSDIINRVSVKFVLITSKKNCFIFHIPDAFTSNDKGLFKIS